MMDSEQQQIPINTQLTHSEDNQDHQQYLTFIMADEEYGIEILSIQEIRGFEFTTSIPNSPIFIQGVMNLRGTIVPVMDLRLRFGLPSRPYGDTTVVIVVKAIFEDSEKIIGMVVDSVSGVCTVDQDQGTKAPDIGEADNREFLKGLINIEEKMIILLDLKKILTFN